ncbi:MAG: hypothetical protein ACI4HI_07275 [Lachnospiraceae bacterium]
MKKKKVAKLIALVMTAAVAVGSMPAGSLTVWAKEAGGNSNEETLQEDNTTTEKSVSNFSELCTAMNDPAITKVTLTASIDNADNNISVSGVKTLSMGSYHIYGGYCFNLSDGSDLTVEGTGGSESSPTMKKNSGDTNGLFWVRAGAKLTLNGGCYEDHKEDSGLVFVEYNTGQTSNTEINIGKNTVLSSKTRGLFVQSYDNKVQNLTVNIEGEIQAVMMELLSVCIVTATRIKPCG